MQPILNFQGRKKTSKPVRHNEDLQAKNKEPNKSQRQKEVTEKQNRAESLRTSLYVTIRKARSNRINKTFYLSHQQSVSSICKTKSPLVSYS